MDAVPGASSRRKSAKDCDLSELSSIVADTLDKRPAVVMHTRSVVADDIRSCIGPLLCVSDWLTGTARITPWRGSVESHDDRQD